MKSIGLHWFRRDLRFDGNPALLRNIEEMRGRVLCVFFFDATFLSRPDFSVGRFAFFIKSLQSLKDQLRERGGDLLVLDDGPDAGFERILNLLDKHQLKPALVTWNRDYEPFARLRDERIERWLQKRDIKVLTERDHLICEPHEVLKDDGTPYRVFTPYYRKWKQFLATSGGRVRLAAPTAKDKINFELSWKRVDAKIPALDRCDTFEKQNRRRLKINVPEAGTSEAFRVWKNFGHRLDAYKDLRDFPAHDATSGLSIFFKNGSITTAQVLSRTNRHSASAEKFISEVAWREFYYSILFNFPYVETESFNPKYRNIKWENDEKLFKKWKSGETGFPLVDAGMRELVQTGRMHNRVRMVVASFLVKDLHIDWRWGERFFMEHLLDGDLAANNGGWQWAASTGCDPQPYFRIFNPQSQAKKFDPENSYIQKWVPEFGTKNELRPIVNHAERARRAVTLYRKLG